VHAGVIYMLTPDESKNVSVCASHWVNERAVSVSSVTRISARRCVFFAFTQKVGDGGGSRASNPLSPLCCFARAESATRAHLPPACSPILINARRLMQIGLKYLSERQTGSNSLTLSHSVGNLPFAAAVLLIL